LIKSKNILFFVLIIICVFPISASDFILVIDPGHGGKETGAIGRKGKEKDINLTVAKLLGQYIADEHPDVKIIYTRTKDVAIGLDERANIANKANANLFISIHANSVKGKSIVSGAEVFTFGVTRIEENLAVAKLENSVILYEDDYEQKYEGFDPNSSESYIIFEFMVNLYSEQSIAFASMVQNELIKTANRKNRGVKQAGFLVLRKSSMPSILVELDFISNQEAENYMLSQTGQRNMAKAISNAFTEYKKGFDRKEKRTITESVAEQPSKDDRNDNMQVQSPEKPVPNSIVYKIQILASTKKLPANSRELKGYKTEYYIDGKYYKYTYGESNNLDEINKIRNKIVKDFKDAFIVTFENGVKVPNK